MIDRKYVLIWYPATFIVFTSLLIYVINFAVYWWQLMGEFFDFSEFGDYAVIEYIIESDSHAKQFLKILAPWMGALAAIGFLIDQHDISGAYAAMCLGSFPATLYSLHIIGHHYK